MNPRPSALEPQPVAAPMPAALLRRAYRCRCGRPVFFRNSVCLACETPLGYDPRAARLLPLEPGRVDGTWVPVGEPGRRVLYRRCGNFASPAACNWLIRCDAQGRSAQPLCPSCNLNRTIPDLTVPGNELLWQKVEIAKRRLVSELMALGLQVRSRLNEDPERGLAFDVMQSVPGGPAVMTGHADGVITLNLDEADDAKREGTRAQMQEPYRTLLGHLRHEVGHYYWDRLVFRSHWLEPFRALFGDEREDYGEALQRHYANGPRPDWPQRHVSAYASSHPWEDWAESWAHYLHMVDTLGTAASFGVSSADVELQCEPFVETALSLPDDPQGPAFLAFINDWVGLSAVLNELARSMGQPDLYPFVLSVDAVRKLHFVHRVVADAIGHGGELPETDAAQDEAAVEDGGAPAQPPETGPAPLSPA
ncbi:zinc-binding metallopeptidase family protein [Caldimonas tepidiphila]|uniref:zinc-binding metallopeptidase family protein n=1 Tax=Caldimonas tepidiphila TaxID=2315841 RepID=UPI001F0B799E|nr:putative zinc-binding metallopeptidase [Caldimonas tepidiphila]